MKFAIIPWDETFLKDSWFFQYDNENRKFKESSAKDMYLEFERHGHEIHTIDMYSDIDEIDYFLFFILNWKWIRKIQKAGKSSRMVYCNGEPPTVEILNTPEGFKKLKNIFPYIMTYNRDWIDNERIFLRNIPYYFSYDPGNVKYENKKLLTAITANKSSNYKDELYSERERAYSFFEKNFPEDFDFYGGRWNSKEHPGYKGKAADKKDIYHNYKFALCLENTKNIKDYLTEKMLDCLSYGIVPIYGGAINAAEYVPKECFIDYFEFKDLDELGKYISSMPKEEYFNYLKCAEKWVKSGCTSIFNGANYTKLILEAINHDINFELKIKGRIITSYYYYKMFLHESLEKIKLYILSKIR